MVSQWWETVLDVIFPPRCPVCRKAVKTHGQWCSTCLGEVWAPRSLILAYHNLAFLDTCYTLCNYSKGVQSIIRSMKFRHLRRYGCYLSWLLSIAPSRQLETFDIIIPVPLSSERLAARGYNQTEVIFRPWANQQGFQWCDILIRTQKTMPQWELTLKQRKSNIKGAFTVTHLEQIQGKEILLVDDIFTTGTTMDECARVLKKAGAASVKGFVIASGAQ